MKDKLKKGVGKEKDVDGFRVEIVATQTTPVILRGDKQVGLEEALVLVLNKLEKLERGLL